MTIVCGDSHTATHGAFGALAFGIGTSEVEHVLATQTLPQARPEVDERHASRASCPPGVTAKDIILAIIGRIGTGGGIGHVIEYRGSAIRALSMEGRMTVCNMSIEAGAKAGMIAPDDTTFEYLAAAAANAPKGADWDAAVADWRTLRDRRRRGVGQGGRHRRGRRSSRRSRWGTNPGQVAADRRRRARPPTTTPTRPTRETVARALEYMGLTPGTPIRDIARRHRVHRLAARTAASRTCAPRPR